MTKARRGRDAPGFDSDRQPGRRDAAVGPTRLGGVKRFGPSRSSVAMRQIQAWRSADVIWPTLRTEVVGQMQLLLAHDQGRHGVVRGQLAMREAVGEGASVYGEMIQVGSICCEGIGEGIGNRSRASSAGRAKAR